MSSSPKRRADGSRSASRLSSSRGSLGALPPFLFTLKTPSGSFTGKAFDRARFAIASYMMLSRRMYWSTHGMDGGGFSKRFEQSVYASYALSVGFAAIEFNPGALVCCCASSLSGTSSSSSSCVCGGGVGAVNNGDDALLRDRCCKNSPPFPESWALLSRAAMVVVVVVVVASPDTIMAAAALFPGVVGFCFCFSFAVSAVVAAAAARSSPLLPGWASEAGSRHQGSIALTDFKLFLASGLFLPCC